MTNPLVLDLELLDAEAAEALPCDWHAIVGGDPCQVPAAFIVRFREYCRMGRRVRPPYVQLVCPGHVAHLRSHAVACFACGCLAAWDHLVLSIVPIKVYS